MRKQSRSGTDRKSTDRNGTKRKIILGVAGAVVLCAVLIVIYGIVQYGKYKDDFARLKAESYDTVFFSMYPTDNYVEEDYMHFRGMQIVKADACIPDTDILQKYMDIANQSGNTIDTVYLGIDPAAAKVEEIHTILSENPDKMFEIAFSHPQLSYWTAMSDEECQETIDKYYAMAGSLIGFENARVYLFAGEEWLLCNPGNYTDTFTTNAEVSQFLMCNSDHQHPYLLTAVNHEAMFQNMRKTIFRYKENPVSYPDASDWDIIFLGDSIFGNYKGSLSIHGVVNGLTGAHVYNLGYGGKSAALSEKTRTPLPAIVEAFVKANLSRIPKEAMTYEGLSEYLGTEQHSANMMFVINYGLNDYFDGLPVVKEDPYDISSYSGALRVAIEQLQEVYPDAVIVLTTPNVTINYENGKLRQSEVGGALVDYVNAVFSLAAELNVEVLDNHNELPIDLNKYWEYMEDGVHLNERGRFLTGKRIVEIIQEMEYEKQAKK